MPDMTLCRTKGCRNEQRCRRAIVHHVHKESCQHQSFIAPKSDTCQSFYPRYKDKKVSPVTQEPLPDRRIAGKLWKMWVEQHGRTWIACGFCEARITHSYACTEGKEQAIEGCVAQIERIYHKPAKLAEGGTNA